MCTNNKKINLHIINIIIYFLAQEYCQNRNYNLTNIETISSPVQITSKVNQNEIASTKNRRSFFGTTLSVAFGTPVRDLTSPLSEKKSPDENKYLDKSLYIDNNPIESFLKALKFTNALVLVATSKNIKRRPHVINKNSNSSQLSASCFYPGSPNPISPAFKR